MKKQFLVSLCAIISFCCYSQIEFENGYFIDNSGIKTTCLIKNIDWPYNPTEFQYKLTKGGDFLKRSIKNVQEFGIINTSKYIRQTVKIDRSTETLGNMSTKMMPDFNDETLFLKVLIEGEANLYIYKEVNLVKFFLNTNSSLIEQLVFKSYESKQNEIRKNNYYRQQLLNSLKCESISTKKLKNLDYRLDDLTAIVLSFNECMHTTSINYQTKKEKRNLFNLSIRPGVSYSSLSAYKNTTRGRNVEFDNELSFRLGAEAEFIMPFNKNKWSFIIEPTYRYYTSEKEIPSRTVNVEYTSIELPLGIRYYMFLNNVKDSKLFLNGLVVFDFGFNSKISYTINSSIQNIEINESYNAAFGLGYKFKDKYSIEFRTYLNRDVLTNYTSWSSDYKSLSLILGYTFF